jgi:hypothetical protein
VASIAEAGLAAGVQTFVIGVFTPQEDADFGAGMNLNTIAAAGGTDRAFIVDASQNVTMQFLEALNTIRGAKLSCEFQVPKADSTGDVDFGRVNVDFSTGATTTRIPRVADQSACNATRGGWYYDVDPSVGEPTRIIVCPSNCETFQTADNASVQIELGCLTEIIE